MHPGRLSVALLGAAWCGGAAGADMSVAGFSMRHDIVLQARSEQSRYFEAFDGAGSRVDALEARLNLNARCAQAWCEGASVVLRARLYGARREALPGAIWDRPSSLAEAYVVHSAGEDLQIGAGKRYLGWGPALLYSPTNRLFPDNGAVSPRKEVPGKPMLFASAALPGAGRASVLAANPRQQDLFGRDVGGVFVLARAEWQQQAQQLSSFGLVAGGGGALAPYAGLYAQRALGDAFTLGGEVALSRRYARDPSRAQVSYNAGARKFDLVLNLRYGMRSGAELGLELVQNGYALDGVELAEPRLAALPSAGSRAGYNRAMHPLVQRRYALLQYTTPSLLGNKRWGVTARSLHGLDRFSRDQFAELSYSATDAITVYAGHARSRVAPELRMTRPVTRNVYLTVESFF